jgi:hypothetical protein
LPYSKQAYRCLSDGVRLHRLHPYERSQTKTRGYGYERELAL